MNGQLSDPQALLCFSKAFSYPEVLPDICALNQLLQSGMNQACMMEENLIGLQNKYVKLFINCLPEVPCVPYGSFYLEGIIMGPSTVKLKHLYKVYGFETHELADHIAVELEFLSILSLIRKQLPESDISVIKDHEFVTSHLNAWLPNFLTTVEKKDQHGLYGGLAKNLNSMLPL